jgi:Domain of unknown function (DUF3523)
MLMPQYFVDDNEQAEEERKRVLITVQSIFEHIAVGALALLSNPWHAIGIAGWILGITAGYFILKEAITLLGRIVSSKLGRPSIVRETSTSNSSNRYSILSMWRALFSDKQRSSNTTAADAREHVSTYFKDVVLPPVLQVR